MIVPLFLATTAFPQAGSVTQVSALPDAPSATLAMLDAQPDADAESQEKPNPNLGESSTPQQNSPQTPLVKKQPKRILFIIPNYRAVSSDANLPPLDSRGKFKLFVDDSFDYSAFVYTGFVAGLRMAQRSYPEFGHGAAGYGRYYWRAFADQAVGNFFTEWAVPSVTKQDPRYFTKGHGSFLSRTGYAASRLVVTRSDSGGSAFNISEIGGNLIAAGISNAYYPSQERTVSNTMSNWLIQLALDGGFDVIKEFWPDIAHKVLHQE